MGSLVESETRKRSVWQEMPIGLRRQGGNQNLNVPTASKSFSVPKIEKASPQNAGVNALVLSESTD